MTIRELLEMLLKGGYIVVNTGDKPIGTLGTRVFRTGKQYTIHDGFKSYHPVGLNKAVELFEEMLRADRDVPPKSRAKGDTGS